MPLYFYKNVRDYITAFNNLRIPVGNFGIMRSSMPQINKSKIPDFIKYIDSFGYLITKESISPEKLRLTQNEINKNKIFEFLKDIRRKGQKNRIIISSDNYVLDGSHRMVALLNWNVMNKKEKKKIDVLRVDMKMKHLLQVARDFRGAKFRTVSDKKIGK